jgi:bZIP-type transcription factor MBZ1
MHLWGKMAAQQQMQQQQQALQNHQTPSNLTSNMRPHFFSTSPKPNLPSSSGYGSTLSVLLSGKHNIPYFNPSSTSSSAYPTPPASPLLLPKGVASLPLPLLHSSQSSSANSSTVSSSQKEQEHAMLAAMASQTVFRKLGNAFWDAFTGSSHSSSSRGDWDADKVRKVLEGKAVLRVVDVEPATVPAAASAPVSSTLSTASTSPKWKGAASKASLGQLRSSTSSASSNLPHATEDGCRTSCTACVCDILEESMRSLSMGKKM